MFLSIARLYLIIGAARNEKLNTSELCLIMHLLVGLGFFFFDNFIFEADSSNYMFLKPKHLERLR